MSLRATAVVFTAPGVVEVGNVTCPEPGPEDVVVELTHSWISTGTESSYLRGERIAGDTPRREGDPWPFPVVAGYQKVGAVAYLGERVTDLAPGDSVFAVGSRVQDMFEPFGGHVSPSVVAREWVRPVPDGVDALAFAGAVLTQVGYNCGVRAPVEPGDPAVVLGDGLVGQWAAQTLALRGADVVLVGRHPERLARFERGAVLDATAEPPGPSLAARFGDRVAALVDTVGSIAAVEELVPSLRHHGHIVSAGFYGVDDRLALQPLREHELVIDVVAGADPRRLDRTLELIAGGQLDTLSLITHRFPVARAPEAWELIRSRAEPYLGVVLDWT